MKIIDNDAVNFVFDNAITLSDVYFVSPDVKEEVILAGIMKNKPIPVEIRDVTEHTDFDESLYLKHYYWAINYYTKRSFSNMKGFGDVSIIALVKTMLEKRKMRPVTLPFPGMEEYLEIYTGDQPLSKFLRKEFPEDIIVFDKTQV